VRRIGLIAGGGKFPLFFMRALEARKVGVVVIGIKDEASGELKDRAQKSYWLRLGEFEKLIRILEKEKIKEVVTLGKIRKDSLFSHLKPDAETRSLFAHLKERSDDALLGAVKGKLAQSGIKIADPREFLSSFIPKGGVLTKRKPSPEEEKDIKFARGVARQLARILKMSSLTLVVRDCTVLAVESAEGTDEVIRRGAALARKKAVVVKISRPGKTQFLDLPVVGTETLRVMKKNKVTCLAIDGRYTVLLEKDKLIQIADQAGITIVVK
jgi:DUF1009 family protein